MKADRTRRRFVAAIRTELSETGVLSPGSVAKRAKVSPATFYNHFRSREAALVSAFEAAMDELLDIVTRGLRVDLLLQQGLADFCAGWAQTCAAFFNSNATLLSVAQAEAPASESLRGTFAARQRESLALYEQFIELGQRAQMIRAGNPRAIAQLLLVTNQSWNHPFLREVEPGDALHQEMTVLMVQFLAPPTALAMASPTASPTASQPGAEQ